MLLIGIALALTIPYYITVSNIGNIDHGVVISGYFGLLLMSAAYTGIGLFASSLSNNQIVSFLLALTIGVFFHIIFGVLANYAGGSFGQIFYYLSMNTHFESISRGVIDTKDLVYFISVAYTGIFLAQKSLESKTS